jgi:hypothetical protein
MSPEQVAADPLDLDTRSDVYALGVILYQLLANRLPYQLSHQLHEAARAIREDDPARLSSISRDYRGDIETIVAKALEKDKGRRYSSAAALDADIRRYLTDQPIAARPASASYQLRKFARRHKAMVTATALVFAVLVAGIIVSAREAVRARRAEQTAQAVNDFLQNDLLAQASASTQASPSTKPDPDLKDGLRPSRGADRGQLPRTTGGGGGDSGHYGPDLHGPGALSGGPDAIGASAGFAPPCAGGKESENPQNHEPPWGYRSASGQISGGRGAAQPDSGNPALRAGSGAESSRNPGVSPASCCKISKTAEGFRTSEASAAQNPMFFGSIFRVNRAPTP